MANTAAAAQTVSVNADAKVLALELRGQTGAMELQIESGAVLTARNGVRISSGGVLHLKGGEMNTCREIDVRSGGKLDGEGLINGQQAVIAGIPEFANLNLFVPHVLNGGVVSLTDSANPASVAAKLSINGDYEQTANGALQIDLFSKGMVGGTDFDQLAATGTVQLGGVLSISLANPLSLAVGDSFQIITAAKGLTGSFSQIMAPPLNGGLGWTVQYSANAALLKVVRTAPYLTIWRQSFGVNAEGDLDGDGDTDGSDFLVWQRQAGLGGELTHAVPEPASSGILLCVTAMGVVSRFKRP
jgi:hypothetical protein